MTALQTRPMADVPSPSKRPEPAGPTLKEQLLDGLPLGNSLSPEAFHARHRLAKLVGLGLLALLLLLSIGSESGVGHSLLEIVPLMAALVVAHRAKTEMLAALAGSASLMFASAGLVHATDGLIESHFLFFVLLPLIALYQDLRAFLLAIGFVLFHHAVIGMLMPEAVYNHPEAIENPMKYGALHAVYVAGLVLVLIVEWNFSEEAQQLAERRLRELETTQAELVQAQKLESVGQLAAGIAHEINTPMQYIGDNTTFLKNTVVRLLKIAEAAEVASGPDASVEDRERLAELVAKSKLPMLVERAPKAADDALTGVENVSRIVAAMKRFSHPGSAELAPVDLNDSIATTLTVCRNEWKYAADVVTVYGDVPTVQGHLGELNQVWLNMIVNAAHALVERHGDRKGTITITTDAPDADHVRVTIADDGAGIAQEHLDRVLDPFFTTKEVGKGTGQGLAIAHQVITNGHHGTLTVDSTKNVGTTFTITLPTQPPTTNQETA